MAFLNIEKLSLSCKDREKEEKNKVNRRKAILVLIYHCLKEYGCIQAANILESEINFNVTEYCICDNIHMESIIQDYESYYFLKYQRKPVIIKKIPENMADKISSSKVKDNRFQKVLRLPSHSFTSRCALESNKNIGENELKSTHKPDINSYSITKENCSSNLKPISLYENYAEDWKCMAELILQNMQTVNKDIKWNDIIGHAEPKELLKEAIVYPTKYKEIFSTPPWRSILLYGPSGTGKTLLASAAAAESGANFFKICVSTLISKWRGESEKLIKVLFDLAKHYAPSIIFIDEIDAMLSHRGEDHEASRRMKTELFIQLDSLFSTDKLVLILSATNMPWSLVAEGEATPLNMDFFLENLQLDYAILRRLEKRLLISYPDEECRKKLFEKFLPQTMKIVNCEIKMNVDYQKLADVTIKYSPSDIEIICKEAKMNYIRQVISALECKMSVQGSISIKALNTSDILKIIDKIKPSTSELCSKYEDWQQKHGSE